MDGNKNKNTLKNHAGNSEKGGAKPNGNEGAHNEIVKKAHGKFNDFKGEFRKIIWPDKKALMKHTANVVITSLAVGAIIVAMDFLFTEGYSLFIGLFQ